MMGSKNVLPLVVIFLLGVVAGFGVGNVYGSSAYQGQLEQKVTDLQNRFNTVNDNYLILVREYNKLFTLKAPSVAAASPVAVVSSQTAPQATTAAPVETKAAPTAVKPAATPTAGAAPKATAAGAGAAKFKAEFKALAIEGTGPLEGPPPLRVKFTDLSTGNITSWKWDFGDGQTSTEKNPEHTYEKCPGDKDLCTVKLTVCGPDGCVTTTKPDYLWVSESCTGC